MLGRVQHVEGLVINPPTDGPSGVTKARPTAIGEHEVVEMTIELSLGLTQIGTPVPTFPCFKEDMLWENLLSGNIVGITMHQEY